MAKKEKLTQKALAAIRREEVGDLHLKGLTRPQIAQQLKISMRTVSRYLSQLRREWNKETAPDEMILLSQELLRIKRLEIAAWQAWEHSQQDLVTNKMSVDAQDQAGKKKAEQTTRSQSGNPQFLQIIAQCILRRCQLMGLHKLMSGSLPEKGINTLIQIGYSTGITLNETQAIEDLRQSACETDLLASTVCQTDKRRALENGSASEGFGPSLN